MNADELISSTSSICTALVTRQVNIIAQRFELAYPPRVLRETIVHGPKASTPTLVKVGDTSVRGKVKIFRSDRGTNFEGAVDDLKIDAINVEDEPLKNHLYNSGTVWKFNSNNG
jgi:hypothetical protein